MQQKNTGKAAPPLLFTRRETLAALIGAAATVKFAPSVQARPEPAPSEVLQRDPYGRVASGGVSASSIKEIYPGVWRIHFGGASEIVTPLTFRTAPADAAGLAALPSVSSIPLNTNEMSWTLSARGVSLQLPMTDNEHIYGLGLDTEIFDMTGRRAICCPSDQPQDKMDYSHAPVPFFVSSRGYGVYVDTARYAWFYTGDVAPAAYADERGNEGAGHASESTRDLYRPRALAHKTMMIDVHPSRGVDIYVFAGPGVREAVQRYNLFSGGGAVPPLWGLGMHFRSAGPMPGNQILELAHRIRREKMPFTMWGLEPGWQSHTYPCSFMWNKKNFPDPDSFIKQMKGMEYHLNLWEHAFTSPVSPMFEPLKAWSGNYLVWGGLVPDFATPEARRIWQRHHDKIMFDKGIDAVKLDECDNQPYRAHPWSFPEASVFPSGMDGELMHSLFGELYQQTMLEPLTRRNLRTWGLVRNTQALAAPLPYTIYSDSYDLACYLRGVCKQGFCGLMWDPELRQAASIEDMYRRIQLVIFSPLAVVDCWYMNLPPWLQINRNLSNRGELMPDHDTVTRVVRSLFELRMSFIPYLYAAFNEYRLTGMPPVRAMVMDWPDDPHTFEIDNQFMFGPSIMVAPILTGQKQRKVYLPHGTWYDLSTQRRLDGGRWITVSLPPEEVPMFVKAGTLLPIARPVEYITPETCFDITLYAFGSSPASITLYEDDGVTLDYKRGRQNRLTITWAHGRSELQRHGNYNGPVRYRITGHKQV
jgi:alpha-D-xyloside xylohydrolase